MTHAEDGAGDLELVRDAAAAKTVDYVRAHFLGHQDAPRHEQSNGEGQLSSVSEAFWTASTAALFLRLQ